MKIITERAAYVQANDITNLTTSNISIPKSMARKARNRDRFDFIKLNDQEKDIVVNTDWILDYDFLKGLSKDEINLLGTGLTEKYTSTLQDTNKPYEERCTESDKVGYKMLGLAYYLLYLEGKIEMTLPRGIEKPKCMEKEESDKVPVKIIK